jgi:hypothetical protein
MPNPDGEGPTNPHVLQDMPNPETDSPGTPHSFQEMPNPEGSGPGSPTSHVALTATGAAAVSSQALALASY